MTTSNSYSFNMSVAELIEDAIQQCELPSSSISAEVIRIAIRQLNLLQQELVNRGTNLWTLSRSLIPLYQGIKEYDLEERTVDLISVQYRRIVRNATTTSNNGAPFASEGDANLAFDQDFDTSCAQSTPGGYIGFQYNNPQFISTIGFRTNGDLTLNLVIEASNDGTSYEVISNLEEKTYLNNKWYWFDIQSHGSFSYWRIRDELSGILDIRELCYSFNDYEIQCAQYNRDDYFDLPFKNSVGEPLNFWYDRQAPLPRLVLWPTPNSTYALMSLLIHRHLQDVVKATETLEIPRRWLDVFSTGLAYRLSKQLPGVNGTTRAALKQDFLEAMAFAEAEESDKSPIYFEPGLRQYTRSY